MDNFVSLPILTRETVMKREAELCIENLNRYQYRSFVTSGSTAEPGKFIAEKIYFQKMMAAEAFYVNFCGLKNFKKYGYLLHKPHLEDLVTYLPKDMDPDALNNLLKEHSIRAIGGSVNRLMYLAELVESRKISPPGLKFILSGSEHLTVEIKKYFEKVFQCTIYNKYVCAETGIMGIECPHRGGFHIDPVNSFMEIVDTNGRPVENDLGRIIITTFNNRLMPLIRYELGDTGRWIKGTCGCGLQTPRLFFEGRKCDYMKFANGVKYSVLQFIRSIDWMFIGIIAKQQVVQESLHRIIFRFVPGPNYETHHKKLIYDYIRHLLIDFSDVEINIVEESFLREVRGGKQVIFRSLEMTDEPVYGGLVRNKKEIHSVRVPT